ncbi:hypothetical protein CVS47_01206 [Microbacterium lemovicicum]|uniref:PKD domain-containing protein n=1 Tax=Microbacterium lemovicicum TaxID=1072463 RepID=A0A3Q9J1T2_9MICO|nr:hypothetical protein [Microbacterium lemovicicum]AZS36599.1 hypothetical protein CVS47_01206 [Microbacterium lemovicicum]
MFRKLILTLSIAAAFVAIDAAAAFADGSCQAGTYTHNCTISNNGSSVDIGGSVTDPGDDGSGGRGDESDAGGGGGGGAEDDGTGPAVTPQCIPSPTEFCRGNYEVVGLPDVTIADLASFVPARPSLVGEPDGVGIVGMATNVVAAASAQDIAGRLFEYDVTVRFTPAGYRFSYGDGTTRATDTGGATWAQLGQADFTATPTSHAYGERGTYTVGVTVLYSAAVDFGTGRWRPVAGFVEATTSGYDVRIVEVRTALVDKTCLENPRGPGC